MWRPPPLPRCLPHLFPLQTSLFFNFVFYQFFFLARVFLLLAWFFFLFFFVHVPFLFSVSFQCIPFLILPFEGSLLNLRAFLLVRFFRFNLVSLGFCLYGSPLVFGSVPLLVSFPLCISCLRLFGYVSLPPPSWS